MSDSIGTWLVVAWAIYGALAPMLLFFAAIKLLRFPQLSDIRPSEPSPWPKLSVIVPACNEADTIEPAMRTLLAQDYPNLEIVVIDDRSTDGTSEIVDRLANEDSRIVAVHVRELPEGWLGKVHALQKGVERASGSWILFTDADVKFAPEALRRSIAHSEQHGFDHLAVLPEVGMRSFWVGTCVGSALRGVFVLARPWEAMNPKSEKAIGTGAFNLVRKSAFDRTPGFEWLKLEVADDIGLGVMMKRFGGKPGLLLGRGQVHVEWYRTVREAIRGLEKNGFAQAARFSLTRAIAFALIAVLGSVSGFAGFIPVGVPWLPYVSAFALAMFIVCSIMIARSGNAPLHYMLFSLPLGDPLMAYIILRATILGLKRGGVIWRGTVYPTELLRQGARVKM